MNVEPLVSIIVPVYNAARHLERCLNALQASTYRSFEIIAVNDASTDGSAAICEAKGVRVLRMPRQSGPAAARNYAAQKVQGEILLFVDSDVVAQPDTVRRVATDFLENSDVAAVFGSYDEDPAERNFVSQYKNLYHHFVHQQSNDEAVTFWAGCGAIRRKVFEAVGGFDQKRFPKPSVEDIDLGYRLRKMGYRILLDKKLMVKHLKEWRLLSLIRTDIFCRAVPWTQLMLERRELEMDLNLRWSDRISAAFVGLSAAAVPLSLWEPRLLWAIASFLLIIALANRSFYGFLTRRRGLLFALRAFPVQLLYYFYSGVTFVLCWFSFLLSGKQRAGELLVPSK